VGMAQTQALVLHLATPAPAQRHKRGIAAYPLLATWCLHSRRRWIATKTTMCTGNGIGFHPIVRHHVLWSRGMDWAAARRAWFAGALRRGSLSPLGPSSSDPWTTRRLQRRLLTKARMMSQWSQVRQSRQQWQQKATQRADHDRSLRTQLARVKHERDRATTARKETRARLRQLETQRQGLAMPHKVDLVF